MIIRTFVIETLTTELYDAYGQRVPAVNPTEVSVVDECSLQEALARVRDERNRRLVECDWTQLPDTPLTDAQKTRWAVYRQRLRDITDNFEWDVTKWPAY